MLVAVWGVITSQQAALLPEELTDDGKVPALCRIGVPHLSHQGEECLGEARDGPETRPPPA